MNARLQANLIRLLARSASNPAFAAAVESERSRELYIDQSRRTVAGVRAEFPKPPSFAIDLPANAGGGANR
jgi:hypothetical protein